MMKISFIAIAFCILSCSSSKMQKTQSVQQTQTVQQSDISQDWNIGLQLWTFRLFTFHDAIAKADSCGIKYVQAFPGQELGGEWQGKFDAGMSAEQRTAVKQYVNSKGITLIAFGVAGADNMEDWRKLFQFAKDMNIPLIVAEPKDEQWDYVDKLAGEYHIPVAIHDHPRPSHYWHPDSVLAAINGHSNLGACADIGHWARSGLNVVECLQKLSGHIWNVHFKDVATFNKTDAEDVNPGKGVVDMPGVFQELKRQGYKGNFSIEHESNWENNTGDVIEIAKFYNQQVAMLK